MSGTRLGIYIYFIARLGNRPDSHQYQKPAPVRAFVPIVGKYVSNTLNVAAATKAIRTISSNFKLCFGMAYAAIDTIKPSTKYLMTRFNNSLKFNIIFYKYKNNITIKIYKGFIYSIIMNVDLLDEDRPIAEQKFVCLSFVSPEHLIKKKELFYFERFVQQYDIVKSMSKFIEFINFVSYKYNIPIEELNKEYDSFVDTFKDKLKVDVSDDYKNFIDKQEDVLEKEFLKENAFQTSVRGLKVRGVFSTQEEAEQRSKMLRETDPNHDVYVGPVGIWLPYHPEAYKTGNVQYLEKELNDLMHEKKINEDKAKQNFEARVKESKINAIEENMKKAKETNNKLTQSINEKGELVSIHAPNDQDAVLGVNASLEDIRKELF